MPNVAAADVRLSFRFLLLFHHLLHPLSLPLPSVLSYNVDVHSAILRTGPPGSRFGYSVVRHVLINSSLMAPSPVILVGAPVARESGQDTRRSGSLYVCHVSDSQNHKQCQKIPVFEHFPGLRGVQDEGWIGVDVVSQDTKEGSAAVCAVRNRGSDSSRMNASHDCALLTNDLQTFRFFEPCKVAVSHKGHPDCDVVRGANSVCVDEEGILMIGDPGSGRIFVSSSGSNNSILRILKNSDATQELFLGMSVAISNTLLRGGKTFLAGAPRASGAGEVHLIRMERDGTFQTKVKLKGDQMASNFGYKIISMDINGDGKDELLVGAPTYFDSQSCGGAVYVYSNEDLNNDLSSPSLTLTNKFCTTNSQSSPTSTSKCQRECHNSWFGSDIEPLGDIDQDGYNDVVVGAPGEENGVVYIFRGYSGGLQSSPSQRISASSLFKEPLNSFGHSLSSSGVDFDSNGFPDLVVGCHASDSVVVLRSRPVIDLHAQMTFDFESSQQVEVNCNASHPGEFCFAANICMAYSVRSKENMKESSELELEVNFEQDNLGRLPKMVYFKSKIYSRKYAVKSHSMKEQIIWSFKKRVRLRSHRKSDCFQVPVYISKRSRYFARDVSIRLRHKMISFTKFTPPSLNAASNFVYLKPLLSQDSLKPEDRGVSQELRLPPICGFRAKCRSNLKVLGLMELPKDDHGTYLFKANSAPEIKLFVQVGNSMEDAHESRLFVYAPILFKGSDKRYFCQPGKGFLVVCELGNPMRGLNEVNLILRFDAAGIEPNMESLNFVLSVNTTSTEADPDDNADSIEVKVIFEVDLMLIGQSFPKEVFYDDEQASKNNDLKIIHLYEVKNVGHNPARGVSVEIDWPMGIDIDDDLNLDLKFSVANINVHGEGHCSVANTTLPPLLPSKFKRNVQPHSINNFFRSILSEPEKSQKILSVDCYNSKSWKCLQIVCSIVHVGVGQSFTMDIQATVDQSELLNRVHSYPEFDRFKIGSLSRINFINNTRVPPINTENKKIWTKTTLLRSFSNQRMKTPNWILIMSCCSGLMGLIVISSLLNKCGFFKRKKFKDKKSEIPSKRRSDGDMVVHVLRCPSGIVLQPKGAT